MTPMYIFQKIVHTYIDICVGNAVVVGSEPHKNVVLFIIRIIEVSRDIISSCFFCSEIEYVDRYTFNTLRSVFILV